MSGGRLGRWFPIGPLTKATGLTPTAACAVLGLNSGRVIRRGINEYQADELATRLGHHPAEIWTDWIQP